MAARRLGTASERMAAPAARHRLCKEHDMSTSGAARHRRQASRVGNLEALGDRPSDAPRLRAAWHGAKGPFVAAGVGLALGTLSELGQAVVPPVVAPVTDSAGVWVVVTLLLALGSATSLRALVGATTCLVGCVGGYYIAAAVRGIAVRPSSIAFWGVAALAAGPVVGIGASWMRRGSARRSAAGAGLVSGLLVGEGAFGYVRDHGARASRYWIAQAALGIALGVVLIVRRDRRLSGLPLALVTGGAAVVMTAAALAWPSQQGGGVGRRLESDRLSGG